jgi:hypothetical protein
MKKLKGQAMKVDEYIELLRSNYFDRYLREGGSAFRLILTDSQRTTQGFESTLRAKCEKDGAAVILLRSSQVKLHLIDQLYFGLARSIDWQSEILKFLDSHVLVGGGYKTRSGKIDVGPEPDKKDEVIAAIRKTVSSDHSYCAEFRIALTHLCLSCLTVRGQSMSMHGEVVQQWLRGELSSITPLKSALIFRKIQRSTARHMLYSTVQFLRRSGYPYVMLLLDLDRYLDAVSVRSRTIGLYYTLNATMELYELLRQAIDDLEKLDGTMVIAMAPHTIVIDERRGLERYQALKMRLWNDFRVKNSQNPLSPMIRL